MCRRQRIGYNRCGTSVSGIFDHMRHILFSLLDFPGLREEIMKVERERFFVYVYMFSRLTTGVISVTNRLSQRVTHIE